jgi:hypothetical protein
MTIHVKSDSKGFVAMRDIFENKKPSDSPREILMQLQEIAKTRLSKKHLGTGKGVFSFLQKTRSDTNQALYEALRDLNIDNPDVKQFRDKMKLTQPEKKDSESEGLHKH